MADHLAVTKPRVVVLLLITAYCAMVVAARGLPGAGVTFWTILGLALSCGGSHSINMWYDRDVDKLMSRTSWRPIAQARLAPSRALIQGIVMVAASVVVLAVAVNLLTAALSTAGFVYYVFIYTMWLKRRTPQNIVIGGGAGAVPPLVGWAAVTGQVGLAAVVMFLIVFFWTPAHFWSLALYKDDDYRRAGIPMMPVARGWAVTKRQALAYTVLLLPVSLLLYLTHSVGRFYLTAAVLLGAGFIAYTVALLYERQPEVRWAKRTFRFSLVYLTVLFAVMVFNVRA